MTKILNVKICLKKHEKDRENSSNDSNYCLVIWRFYFYFQPLPTWVRRDSKIIADFSVDRERLLNMGYSNVFQCSAGASSKRGENTNSTIMDYLKRVVPRMFQVRYFLFLFLSILTLNYTKRLKITLNDTNWLWMKPNDTKWNQYEKIGLKKLKI